MAVAVLHVQTIGPRASERRVPRLPEDRCRESGKRRFATAREANQALADWASIQSRVVGGHVYECQHCRGYHFSKRTA